MVLAADQQFNTSTSHGPLTLKLLPQMAQTGVLIGKWGPRSLSEFIVAPNILKVINGRCRHISSASRLCGWLLRRGRVSSTTLDFMALACNESELERLLRDVASLGSSDLRFIPSRMANVPSTYHSARRSSGLAALSADRCSWPPPT